MTFTQEAKNINEERAAAAEAAAFADEAAEARGNSTAENGSRRSIKH